MTLIMSYLTGPVDHFNTVALAKWVRFLEYAVDWLALFHHFHSHLQAPAPN
jgi:hypothetical protein